MGRASVEGVGGDGGGGEGYYSDDEEVEYEVDKELDEEKDIVVEEKEKEKEKEITVEKEITAEKEGKKEEEEEEEEEETFEDEIMGMLDNDDDDDDDKNNANTNKSKSAKKKEGGGPGTATNLFAAGGIGASNRRRTEKELEEEAEYNKLMAQQRANKAQRENLKNYEKERAENEDLYRVKKKVVRKRITTTKPNGTQTVTFKFIVGSEQEVHRVLAKNERDRAMAGMAGAGAGAGSERAFADMDEEDLMLWHTQFEDDEEEVRAKALDDADNDLISGKTRFKSKGGRKRKSQMLPGENGDLVKVQVKTDRNRGKKPHVILAEKLEIVRLRILDNPKSLCFRTKVQANFVSASGKKYKDVVKKPMDLTTMMQKVAKFKYKSSESFLQDLHLIRNNAMLYNGATHQISLDAAFVCDLAERDLRNSDEFGNLLGSGRGAEEVASTTDALLANLMGEEGGEGGGAGAGAGAG